MSTLQDIIASMRAGLAGVKRAGNEGVCLQNAKGFYRPAKECLEPALIALNASEDLTKSIKEIMSMHGDLRHPMVAALTYALNEYEGKLDGNNEALNSAKARLTRSKV